VSLQQEFKPDLDQTFFNIEEFAHPRQFLIVEDREEVLFTTNCVWDTEALKSRLIVQQQGVFMGTVLLFIHKKLFKVEPKPEQIIYTPVTPHRIGWRIVEVTDAEHCYEIALDKLVA
jgi:hypothetical protein